eukprot:TRINITY_DN84987_c0_g1_i1.p2 TRINITY_DN84987_c0_g1~~TRINITY_DN84987_c0_g1_i1.p2  ORF type:complete len:111 (-),score=18.08 TRINITY_DN84987_c0_g1_i1:29-361(-)
MARGEYELELASSVYAWQQRVEKEALAEAAWKGMLPAKRTGWLSYNDVFVRGAQGPSSSQRATSRSGKLSRSRSESLTAAAAAALAGEGGTPSGSRPESSRLAGASATTS